MSVARPFRARAAVVAVAAAFVPLSVAVAQPGGAKPTSSVVVVNLSDAGISLPGSDAGAPGAAAIVQSWNRISQTGDYMATVCNNPTAHVMIPKGTSTAVMQLDANNQYCVPTNYSRGAGTLPRGCTDGYTESSGFCYAGLPDGWVMRLGFATPPCPPKYTWDGTGCGKPNTYGRGAGYALWDENECKKDHPRGCEKNGAMWYPKCREGFHAVGCCICSPDCPSGWTDTGLTCTPPRKVLTPKPYNKCDSDRTYTEGLCYTSCAAGYVGSATSCQLKDLPKK